MERINVISTIFSNVILWAHPDEFSVLNLCPSRTDRTLFECNIWAFHLKTSLRPQRQLAVFQRIFVVSYGWFKTDAVNLHLRFGMFYSYDIGTNWFSLLHKVFDKLMRVARLRLPANKSHWESGSCQIFRTLILHSTKSQLKWKRHLLLHKTMLQSIIQRRFERF